MQSGINKHELIFSKTNKIARARRASAILKKLTSAYLFQTAPEKSCDYVLIIYMKKYEIAYHNYAEAKRAHQVQFIQTCAFGQNNRVRSKQYYSMIFSHL